MCEASREDGEDAESKGQAANAHVRIMCVSCVSCVYLCNDVCTYHMCPRLVGSFDYCARAYMLTHTVFTNTTCEEKKPQVHRRNQGPVAVRIQLQASQPLARRPLLVSVATGNQARECTPGPRAGNATSDRACKFTAQLRAGAAGGWRLALGIRTSWPAACPPQIRVFVVCLCPLSDEFNSSHLAMLTTIGALSRHRAYLGVGGALLLVNMECSSMRAEDGHLSRDGGICRRQF